MDFKGSWKTEDGYLAEVTEKVGELWLGFVTVKDIVVPTFWTNEGKSINGLDLVMRRRGDEPF